MPEQTLQQREQSAPIDNRLLMIGFIVGIACGAVLIWSSGTEPEQATDDAVAAETSAPADNPQPDQPVPFAGAPTDGVAETSAQTDNPQNQVDLQRRQIQQERARRQMEELRRDLALDEDGPAGTAPRSNGAGPASRARSERSPRSAASTPRSGRGQRTLDYWNAINTVIVQESAMRTAPAGGVNAANAGNFFSRRITAARFAADSIRDLDRTNVDPKAISLAEAIADWYDEEAEVAEEGQSLLTAGIEARKGARGKRYKGAEHAHRKAVNALNRRGLQLREELSGKYGLAFPKLK